MVDRTCSIPDCGRIHEARGLCKKHYKSAGHHGTLPWIPKDGPEYLADENGCWIWQRSLRSTGYGNYSKGRSRIFLAHRIIYERLRGPIPEGLELDHLCRVRACVNPDHLEPVTHLENIRRALPTHCKRGHPRTTENRYVRPSGGGGMCLPCMLHRARERNRSKVA